MKKLHLIVLSSLVVVAIGAIAYYLSMTAPTKGPSTPPVGNRPPQTPLTSVEEPAAEAVALGEGQTRYRIDTSSAVATFTLDEMLRGSPKTVVGTSTGMLAGEIGVNTSSLVSSTIGTIKLNARSFVTDENNRNNMIRRAILKTENDANEFITFKTTELSGTSSSFTIVGELTIAGVTKPATFLAKTSLGEDGKLVVEAKTVVKRDDYGILIPSIPFVADVENTVDLDLNFTASPV